jgi:hypothetical protein
MTTSQLSQVKIEQHSTFLVDEDVKRPLMTGLRSCWRASEC